MIKKQDFVELEYTGLLKENEVVFDTTDEKLAKDKGLHNPQMSYGPLVIVVGEGNVIKGFDNDLIGKDVGKEYNVELEPENAFGKKDAKLFKIVPTNIFKKQNINPQPRLQVNIDGMLGTIKTVSGGRTIVDFNHPLSGREIIYKYKILKIVEDDKEKVKHYLILALNCKSEGFDIKLEEDKAEITLKKGVNLDDNAKKILGDKLVNLIPNLKEVSFK